MEETVDILDYTIHWRSKSETGFIGELFHSIHNDSNGSWNTPTGHIIGFIEPQNTFSSSHWKVIITVRKDIRYDVNNKSTYVFIKSAYASKLKFYFEKIAEFTKNVIRLNPNLPIALKEELISREICNSPISIQMIIGKEEYVYSDVEFNFDFD